jgi:hypothetical protein
VPLPEICRFSMRGSPLKRCCRGRSASARDGCPTCSHEFRNQIRAGLPGKFLKLSPTAHRMYHPELWGAGSPRRSRSRREVVAHRPGFAQKPGAYPSPQVGEPHHTGEVAYLAIPRPVNILFTIFCSSLSSEHHS